MVAIMKRTDDGLYGRDSDGRDAFDRAAERRIRQARTEGTYWQIETALSIADGAAWAEAVGLYAGTAFDARLGEMLAVAGRTRAQVMDHVHLFSRWKAGERLIGPDGRELVINLAEHDARVERAMQRDRIESPQPPRDVLDRGGW